MKVTTEVDQAGAHHVLKVGGDDGGSGIMTKPDSGVRLMGRLGEQLNYNISAFLDFSNKFEEHWKKIILYFIFFRRRQNPHVTGVNIL